MSVQYYLDKLTGLKEWMVIFVADRQCIVRQMDVFRETGILLYRVDKIHTFEDWWDKNYWKYTFEAE